MIDLLSGFATAAACIALPCVLSFAVFPGLRRNAFFVAGILAGASLACLCAVSALLHLWLAPGRSTGLICVAVSTILVLAFTRIWRGELESLDAPEVNPTSLFPVVLLAGAAIVDCFVVFNAQTWGIDGRVPYFHNPLQLDPRRTADLVAALARGADSLFLPGSRLVYQVFWHHGAATLLALLPVKASVYHQVAGIGLATAFLMYAFLFWALKLTRPAMRWASWALLLAFVLSVVEGQIGAYSDALVVAGYRSFEWMSLHLRNSQYFSLKLLAITAPQHAMFVALFVAYVGVRWNSKIAICRTGSIAWLLCVAAVVASPILAAILLPFYFVAETCFTRHPHRIARESIFLWSGLVAASSIAHWLILQFPIWDLFLRGQASNISYVWRRGFPFIDISVLVAGFIGTNGALGIAFSIAAIPALILARKERDPERTAHRVMACCAALAGGFIFWNFVVMDTEIRRHSSIAACALMLLVTFFALSSPLLTGAWRKTLFVAVAAAAVLGVVIHAYMIRGYSGHNASSVSFNTPWGDYLEANRVIREQRPAAAIIAASGEGMVLPVANEVAVTLAPKLAVYAHQKVDKIQQDFLAPETGLSSVMAAELTTEWRRKAMAIGYDTVMWGPVEEEVWGIVGRTVLLDGATFLASRGRVGIFSLPRKEAGSGPDRQAMQAGETFLAFSVCEQSSRSLIGQAGYHLEWYDGNYRVVEPSTMRLIKEGPVLQQLWSSLGGGKCVPAERLPATVSAVHGRGLEQKSKARVPGSIRNLTSSSSIQHSLPAVPEGAIRTKVEDYPWVQADLGEAAEVQGVRVVAGPRRTDGVPMRHVIVSVSESPFPPGFDPLGYSPRVHAFHVPELIEGDTLIPLRAFGRYVRLTVPGTSAIAIERYEVFR